MSAELPLLTPHPDVAAAVEVFRAGDHAEARRLLARIDRSQLTAADTEGMRLLDGGLRFDPIPLVVMGVAIAGWLFLLLRAI